MPVYDPSLRSAPTVGESGQSSNTRLLGSPGVHSPHGMSVVSAVLVQLAIVTKRQTHTQRDHATTVTVVRIVCPRTAMRPKYKHDNYIHCAHMREK